MKTYEWISVNVRKPSNSREVLVYAPNCAVLGPILLGCYYSDSKTWTVYDFEDSKLNELVTHWQPLPRKP